MCGQVALVLAFVNVWRSLIHCQIIDYKVKVYFLIKEPRPVDLDL
jgi:hypothetical protein